MPRFGETRLIAALFGLATGLVLAVGSSPAHAVHQTLQPGESGTLTLTDQSIGFFGSFARDTLAESGEFTHTYTFDIDLQGLPDPQSGSISATPNVNPPVEIANGNFTAAFAEFEANLIAPDGTVIPLERFTLPPMTPRTGTIGTLFAAIDTTGAGVGPYMLTVMGTLLETVFQGTYSANASVVPLPGAALVFLSALGGLVAVRRWRQKAAAA